MNFQEFTSLLSIIGFTLDTYKHKKFNSKEQNHIIMILQRKKIINTKWLEISFGKPEVDKVLLCPDHYLPLLHITLDIAHKILVFLWRPDFTSTSRLSFTRYIWCYSRFNAYFWCFLYFVNNGWALCFWRIVVCGFHSVSVSAVWCVCLYTIPVEI